MLVYINQEFLQNFFLNPTDTDIYEQLERFLTKAKSAAKIILDFDVEEAYNDPDLKPIIRQIQSKFHNTDASFLETRKNKEFYEHSEAKLLLIDGYDDITLSKDYGCIAISTTHLSELEVIFNVEDIRISQVKHADWNLLEGLKHPCNALIITDNYLLGHDTNWENTKSILKSMMPKKLNPDITFHLTFIGYDPKKENISIQTQYNEIKEFLEKEFDYPIELSIIRENHHGRYIHTNYYRIQCEKGFNLFKNNKLPANNVTSLDCKPITNFGNQSTTEGTRKDELKICAAIIRTDRLPNKFIGSKLNRLTENLM